MKKIIIALLTLNFLSCSTYKSYKIADTGKISKVREKQFKYMSHYGERSVRNYTYYIPKEICLKNDTVALKKYADIIYKRHWSKKAHLPENILYLKMTNDSIGTFAHKGVRLRDAYCDLTYYKTKNKIVFRHAASYY